MDTTLTDAPNTPFERKPEKIGGWLIVVAIGLVLSALTNLNYFLSALLIFFKRTLWEKLTTPGAPAYHPYWKPLLIYDLVSSLILLLMTAVSFVLFLQKRRAFPTFIVVGIPIIFLLAFAGHYLSSLIPQAAATKAYAEASHVLWIRFVALHVWIPYFLVSKRVKRTFVR